MEPSGADESSGDAVPSVIGTNGKMIKQHCLDAK